MTQTSTADLLAAGVPFRYVGTTDDVVTCERCGKQDLRCTVVLALLDEDGNDEGVTYYGTTCAARALKLGRGGALQVEKAATAAQHRVTSQYRDALEFLAYVGVDVQGRPMFTRDGVTRLWGPAARRYRMANPVRSAFSDRSDMVSDVQSAVARKVAILADARRLGLLV